MQEILDGGRLNCLSASLFYALVARAVGYPTQVVETQGHVFVRLRIGKSTVDVETTSSRGFDVDRRLASYSAGYLRNPEDFRWLRLSTIERTDTEGGLLWPVSLEEAVGFAWLNTAWRSLEDDPVATARAVLEARRFLPDLATRAKGAERLLVLAFQSEYESGRFDEAYRIAKAGILLYPTKTTARDRVTAAALKRIQELSDAGLPSAAERLLDEVASMSVPRADVARLERGCCSAWLEAHIGRMGLRGSRR